MGLPPRDVEVVTLAGELDIAIRPELSARLIAAAERDDVATVRLDVRGVTFIDCSCLGAIDLARRCLEAGGRRLTIDGASGCFRRVCELAAYTELVAAAADHDVAPLNG